jgi:hypothetical protein
VSKTFKEELSGSHAKAETIVQGGNWFLILLLGVVIPAALTWGIIWFVPKLIGGIGNAVRSAEASSAIQQTNRMQECYAEAANKKVLILNGGFRQQIGTVVSHNYEGECFLEIKLDKSGAVIQVKSNNYKLAE